MTATLADEILATLQRSYDAVRPDTSRSLTREDDITGDLALDSLDFLDLVAVLDEDFPPEVVDAVVEQVADLRTVGDVIDCIVATH